MGEGLGAEVRHLLHASKRTAQHAPSSNTPNPHNTRVHAHTATGQGTPSLVRHDEALPFPRSVPQSPIHLPPKTTEPEALAPNKSLCSGECIIHESTHANKQSKIVKKYLQHKSDERICRDMAASTQPFDILIDTPHNHTQVPGCQA